MDSDLFKLGLNASYDIGKLSSNTRKSMSSHLKLLKLNNVELNKEYIQNNYREIISNLKNKNNKPINEAYKKQIFATLQRVFGVEGKMSFKVKNPIHFLDAECIQLLKLFIIKCFQIVKYSNFDTFRKFETTYLMLFVAISGARPNELIKLTISDLEKWADGKSIFIKTKTRRSREIPPLDLLIYLSRQFIEQAKLRQELFSQTNLNLKNNNYIFVQSYDFLLKEAKNMWQIHLAENSSREKQEVRRYSKLSFGFNWCRKLTTTLLADLNMELAQAFNAHSTSLTTSNHYVFNNNQAIDNAQNELIEVESPYVTMPETPMNQVEI